MVYLVDFFIGLETFGMEHFRPKNRVRGGIRVIGGRVIGGVLYHFLRPEKVLCFQVKAKLIIKLIYISAFVTYK